MIDNMMNKLGELLSQLASSQRYSKTHNFSTPATACQSGTDLNGFSPGSALAIHFHPLIGVLLVNPGQEFL
jgi:hypothetical protein